MESSEQRNTQTPPQFSLYLKCGAIFLLLLTSFIVVACTQANPGTTNLGAPPVTITIQFNKHLTTTSLPTQDPYLCGAWLTNTSPNFTPGSTIPIYAKFVHLVNNNPQGVSGATAQAVVHLANYQTSVLPAAITGPDGLAVFSFQLPNDPKIANHYNLVTITFTAASGESCKVDQDRAAYFTPLLVTPTVTATATPQASDTPPAVSTPPMLPTLPGMTPPSLFLTRVAGQ